MITKADNNDEIKVKRLDFLLIELPVGPGCSSLGDPEYCDWYVGDNNPAMVLEDTSHQLPAARPGFVWVKFQAVGTGTSDLSLAQFSYDPPPIDS